MAAVNPRLDVQSWDTELIGAQLADGLKNIIEINNYIDINNPRLRDELKKRIAYRLGETGMASHDAATIAELTVRDFQKAAGDSSKRLARPYVADLAAQLMISFKHALHQTSTEGFNGAAYFAHELEIPSLRWNNKHDRLPKETPVEFLRRVWGKWLDADCLYQDTLRRLGEDKLVRAIRYFCKSKGLQANDYLPPPKSVRTERAFNLAEPGPRRQTLRKLIRRRKTQPQP